MTTKTLPAADIQYRPSREELFDLLLDASSLMHMHVGIAIDAGQTEAAAELRAMAKRCSAMVAADTRADNAGARGNRDN
jgi:hypothetical protein